MKEKTIERAEGHQRCQGRRQSAETIREAIILKTRPEQRFEGDERMMDAKVWGRKLQPKGTVSAKTPSQEGWSSQNPSRERRVGEIQGFQGRVRSCRTW